MIKWIKRIFLILLISSFGLALIFIILFKLAFGPVKSTKHISVEGNNILMCKETYEADMATEFYDVQFSLKNKNGSTFDIGTATFYNKEWEKNIHLYILGNWYILPVKEENYSKILLANKFKSLKIDTIFSPLNLRYDSLWKVVYKDIPSEFNYGSSITDTLIGNILTITYSYRIGDYSPFKFYNQSVEYLIDTTKGTLITTRIFDRKERLNGS